MTWTMYFFPGLCALFFFPFDSQISVPVCAWRKIARTLWLAFYRICCHKYFLILNILYTPAQIRRSFIASRKWYYNLQIFYSGCTWVISAAFTKALSIFIKILNTINYIPEASCFLLQLKPLTQKQNWPNIYHTHQHNLHARNLCF